MLCTARGPTEPNAARIRRCAAQRLPVPAAAVAESRCLLSLAGDRVDESRLGGGDRLLSGGDRLLSGGDRVDHPSVHSIETWFECARGAGGKLVYALEPWFECTRSARGELARA